MQTDLSSLSNPDTETIEQSFTFEDIASRFHAEDDDKRLKLVEIQSLRRSQWIRNALMTAVNDGKHIP